MSMIVGLHYLNPAMGGAIGELDPTHYNFYITYFLESMFVVGVNCFVLITGYFQINKTSINIKNVLNLLGLTFFYSVILYFVGVHFGDVPLSLANLLKATFPFFTGVKWFIETYIILYLLTPFINKALNLMSKKEYQYLIGTLLLFFSIWPSMLPSPPVEDRGYGIINFVLLYVIGAYLRKFEQKDKSKAFYFGGFISSTVIVFLGSTLAKIILGGGEWIIWGYNFFFNITGAVFLFLFFSKLDIQSKLINYIATFTLGVYFIHADPSLNNVLYEKILKTQNYWFSPLFIVHALMSIAAVYIGCTIIDMIRKWLFGKIGEVIEPFFKKHLPILWKQIP